MTRASSYIHFVGDHPTIGLAARELARCIGSMSGKSVSVSRHSVFERHGGGLWVGLASSFPDTAIPEVNDPRLDDAIAIDVSGERGIVAGVNHRSVLLAAYRYLAELGCRWVRPGADGEYLPRSRTESRTVRLCEVPSYRHRGVCIEGAVSLEHLSSMIEWLPRVGLNSYFIQFREGFTFFDRWYSHAGNPLAEAGAFSVGQAREIVSRATQLIRERDLVFHAVGHGWTCEPLGIPGLGWEYPSTPTPATAYPYLALVNGKRDLWEGIPLNTNLCYSNAEVRSMVCVEIARYAQSHPEVDVLHFWLADGSNNQCECESCLAARPSDFYVRMLNDLDALLTRIGLATRIVFLIYVDLLWPPETERIANPERFLLMFAPITRTYSAAFAAKGPLPAIAPYSRNRLVFPKSVAENVAHLEGWKAVFNGDGFDFDYHLMWDHYSDPGYSGVTRVLYEDIQRLSEVGLNGLMSCQTQRAFLPTGMPMCVMGWTLWNRHQDLGEMTRDYYAAAFGNDGEKCARYLEKLTELFDPPYLRGEKPAESRESAERLEQIPETIDAFRPTMARNLARTDLDPCWAASWRYLSRHAEIVERLAKALALRSRGKTTEASVTWAELREMAWELEGELHHVFDTWLFTKVLDAKLSPTAHRAAG